MVIEQLGWMIFKPFIARDDGKFLDSCMLEMPSGDNLYKIYACL